ncbi:hypothetical protein AALP_AA1G276800 [Arabis alpina]|uniref:Late embryogenesis abundant protein LEA-2 subgroup domain-containing protein n=1 Tax=Arabis alpina TaxID=50452 RepID=A0A087HR26_ARAAL|nr:hypothetical protein AALP_AA1G276800 [Arabis alpina]
MSRTMAAFVIFIGLVATAIFLVLILLCSPDFPEVTLASLTVTKFNSTGGDHISGHWNLQFQVLNPNLETDFFYEDFCCSVYHGKNLLASTVFPRFVQKARETTPINVTVYLTQETSAIGIGNDLTNNDFAEFDVKLTTIIKWSVLSLSSDITISCDDVAVGLLHTVGGHGKMIGPARKCKVS